MRRSPDRNGITGLTRACSIKAFHSLLFSWGIKKRAYCYFILFQGRTLHNFMPRMRLLRKAAFKRVGIILFTWHLSYPKYLSARQLSVAHFIQGCQIFPWSSFEISIYLRYIYCREKITFKVPISTPAGKPG